MHYYSLLEKENSKNRKHLMLMLMFYLNGSSVGHSLVGVDGLVQLLTTEEILNINIKLCRYQYALITSAQPRRCRIERERERVGKREREGEKETASLPGEVSGSWESWWIHRPAQSRGCRTCPSRRKKKRVFFSTILFIKIVWKKNWQIVLNNTFLFTLASLRDFSTGSMVPRKRSAFNSSKRALFVHYH